MDMTANDLKTNLLQTFLYQPLDSYLAQVEVDSQGRYLLELQELQRFWRLPVKYFFNQRLKTYLDISQLMVSPNG